MFGALFLTPANNPSLKLTATCNGVASANQDDCEVSVQVKEGSTFDSAALGTGAAFSFADAEGTGEGTATLDKTIELLVTDNA